MSRPHVAVTVATALLIITAGCGGLGGSSSQSTATPNESSEQQLAQEVLPSEDGNIDAARLQRSHSSQLEDATSYVVRQEIQIDYGRTTDVNVAVRQHEDRLGTYESIDTQHIDAGVWRPEDTDAVFVRQGDSVTYVGPDVEAETRPADIRNQSVSLFVDQLSRRSLQINGTTTVRGSPAVTVDGNASVVPGSKIDEPEPVDDVQVNGVITDEMVVQEAQVQYERPYTTNEPTVTRRYEVVSMGQGITEPEWIHDAPQISAEKITPHEVRLRNTGERPIPVGSYITIQYDDTRLSIPLETQIDSGETVRIHRPPEESDDDSNPLLRDNEDSTTPPPLRVSSSSVDSEQARSLPDDVIVSVRVGDDAAQVEAS